MLWNFYQKTYQSTLSILSMLLLPRLCCSHLKFEVCPSLPLSGNGSSIFGWILISPVYKAPYSITLSLFSFYWALEWRKYTFYRRSFNATSSVIHRASVFIIHLWRQKENAGKPILKTEWFKYAKSSTLSCHNSKAVSNIAFLTLNS